MTLVFLTTFPTKKSAAAFSKHLLQKKWAACLNIIGPIQSHYIWRDKLTRSKEYLVIGKTTQAKFKLIKKNITRLHKYELPELISLKINDGYKPYLNWIKNPI